MPRTFTCLHCGRVVSQNPRIKKKQQFCSQKECQQYRMRTWKKSKYKESNKYRKKTKEHQKQWRKSYPADQYQREYRETHPEYVNRNREQQGRRNKSRKTDPVSLIVKTDALLLQPREDGAYMLSKIKKKLIVNRNALSLQPSVDGAYVLFKVKEKKIVNRNALMTGGQNR
jgi:ribosome-binding protein aMBF1 (putative translation factor)